MRNTNSQSEASITGTRAGGLSCGPSCFTLQGRIYFQQNKTWLNNFLGLDIIPFEAILRDWMEKKKNETIALNQSSGLPRWCSPIRLAHSFLQRPAHNNDAQSIAKAISEMGTVHPGTIAMTDFLRGLRPRVLTHHLGIAEPYM